MQYALQYCQLFYNCTFTTIDDVTEVVQKTRKCTRKRLEVPVYHVL